MKQHSAVTSSFLAFLFVVLANQPTISGPNTWTSSGLTGQVTQLAVAPSSPNVLYAYHREEKAVLKSMDAGRNWTQVLTDVVWMGALAVHPSNPDIVFASAYSISLSKSAAVLRSNDGGETWVEVDLGQYADPSTVFDVQFHPANPDIIDLVGSYSIYRSVDGGSKWNDIAGDICFT